MDTANAITAYVMLAVVIGLPAIAFTIAAFDSSSPPRRRRRLRR